MADDTSEDDLPLATLAREADADLVFEGWRTISPREWVGRYGHTVYCSSFDQFRYRNAALQAWIMKVHKIMADPAEAQACQKEFLPPTRSSGSEEGGFS